MCTSVWGCGRRREAPAKSQAEQRTEKWFILRLNYLSEQRLGKVTFCRDIFEMYLYKYVANTMKYTFYNVAASPLVPPQSGTQLHISSYSGLNGST